VHAGFFAIHTVNLHIPFTTESLGITNEEDGSDASKISQDAESGDDYLILLVSSNFSTIFHWDLHSHVIVWVSGWSLLCSSHKSQSVIDLVDGTVLASGRGLHVPLSSMPHRRLMRQNSSILLEALYIF
jgi:hypothetical protein